MITFIQRLKSQTATRQFKAFFKAAALGALVFSSCTKPDFKPMQNPLSASSVDQAAAAPKPNVIFILGDDIGYEVLTSYGGQSYQTPNLDMMAQRGMRFTQCYSSPLCSPSRVAIMTGKYNFRNYDEWGILSTTQRTFGNIFQQAGYATYVAGKWQLDGGDSAAHTFGFDDYSLWNPIKDARSGYHYKDPTVYEHGDFLPDSYTQGKYGDDIFTNRVLNFIDSNKARPFFVYYPITLCHSPFSPTPNDAAFASWDTRGNPSDPSFFPSMVKYMDDQVGLILNKLTALGIDNNTLVVFAGDNGTPSEIYSLINGQLVQGGKSQSNKGGTNVPLVAMWPARTAAGQVNSNLVDFSDFLPTFASLAGTTVPASFGALDGKSFANLLTGKRYVPKTWVYNYYSPNTNSGNDIVLAWINNTQYKLYDSTKDNPTRPFFDIVNDPNERLPLYDKDLTKDQKKLKRQFQNIMNTMHN